MVSMIELKSYTKKIIDESSYFKFTSNDGMHLMRV